MTVLQTLGVLALILGWVLFIHGCHVLRQAQKRERGGRARRAGR